jgi:hypothetical protein
MTIQIRHNAWLCDARPLNAGCEADRWREASWDDWLRNDRSNT